MYNIPVISTINMLVLICTTYPFFLLLTYYYFKYCLLCSRNEKKKGNGQERELQVLFGQKRMYPENNSGRECCWPYLTGQHPLSPVLAKSDRVLPVIATLLSFHPFLAILCSVFGHFCSFPVGYSTTRTDQHGPQEQLTANFAQVTWSLTKFSHFSVNNFGSNQLYPCLFGGYSKSFLKENQNAPRPSEHPPVRGGKCQALLH